LAKAKSADLISAVSEAVDGIRFFEEDEDYDPDSNAEVYDVTALSRDLATIASSEGSQALTKDNINVLMSGAKALESILSQVGMPEGGGSERLHLLQRCRMWEGKHDHDETCRCSLRSGNMTAVLMESGSIKTPRSGSDTDGRSSISDESAFFTVHDFGKYSEQLGWTLLNLGGCSKATSRGASSGQ
jgi:hypothetical protein